MIYETLLIGLLAAIFYTEFTDIYPGGIIVPAYLALYLNQPLKVLITILIAFLSLYSYKMLARFLILFGKRRFVMFVLLGVFWAQVWFILFPHFFSGGHDLKVIGWIIPGLLANNLERQRFFLTLVSLFTVSIFTYFLVRVLFGAI